MERLTKMHLADPVDMFPDCRLWLAHFGPGSGDPSADLKSTLAAAQLSSRDLRRWEQYRPAAKKRQFLNSRLAMRSVLQRELGSDSKYVQFDGDIQGRPVLLSPQVRRLPEISLSHSHNTIAIAISDGEFPIGVDIEIVEPLLVDALRQISFHPHELAWCDQQSGQESEAVATLWTIKESLWKTLHCDNEISIADIFLEIERGPLIAHIRNSRFEDSQFRTRLFVNQCQAHFSDTLCLAACETPLRGCVSKRIK